jgi:hypothetical protein
MGQVPFSLTLVLAWNKLKAWKLLIKKLKGGRVNSRFLHRVMKAAAIPDAKLLSVSEAEDNLANCQINYQRLKNEAPTLRASWLESLAVARATQGNSSVAQEMKNILTREKQRREARIIKFSMAQRSRKGLSSIEVPNKHNGWTEISEQNAMEEALLQELKTRFNQAAKTPFQLPPLLPALGPLGVSEAARDILRGRFNTSDVDEWASGLIPFLAQVIETEQPKDLTPDQYKHGWKRVKEKTAAGPSGISTIPHMKAHGASSYLTEVDCILANLPYRHGFPPCGGDEHLMLCSKRNLEYGS